MSIPEGAVFQNLHI